MKLICFPYAGGSSSVYRSLFRNLSSEIDIHYMEYPGHGLKSHEALIPDLELIAQQLFAELQSNHLLNTDYLLYGHSMGALIAFLIAQKAELYNLKPPHRLIISGRAAPHTPANKSLHTLPSEAFWQALQKMGGIPNELLQDKQLKLYFERIIRADIRAVETWRYNHSPILSCPVDVWYGHNESVTRESAEAWQQVTRNDTSVESFTGGHFFIFEHTQRICSRLNSLLPLYSAKSTA